MSVRRLPQIVAFGGGGFSMERGNPLLDDYVLRAAGVRSPRVCFLPSASGDADHYIVRFYQAFGADRCEPSHVSLFRREHGPPDIRAHLLAQDVIYVGGGSVVSLIGVWKAHGIDEILAEAWNAGVLLCGLSAGSLCWFREGISAYHGAPRRIAGLGLLPWSNTVHYDGEPTRRTVYHEALRDGMCSGFAVDDGAALHFTGTELTGVVASRPTARAYRVAVCGDEVIETPMAADYLGVPVAVAETAVAA